jgi:hypothetical protein
MTARRTPTSSGDSNRSDCATSPTETPPIATSGKVRRTSSQTIVTTAYAVRVVGADMEPVPLSATAAATRRQTRATSHVEVALVAHVRSRCMPSR